jgi:molybdopterin converting factor subunit 1
MKIRILFFAAVREQAGLASCELEPEGQQTVGAVWSRLLELYPQLGKFGLGLLFALNQEYATPDTPIRGGDELAVFPPVSGGATEPASDSPPPAKQDLFQIVRCPIQLEPLIQQLSLPEDGAVVSFLGTVRNNAQGRRTRHLEYEGFEPMALKKLQEIGQAIHQQWEVNRIGIVHRLGRLEIGEISVVIVICAPHREAAFDACRFAIDTLKMIVPIWKKEFFMDGEVWVEGKPVQ